ncbi:methylated-DNA--[protein]-cysteine S-methyltransferase [Thermodesulfobacteriota bacterium]
MKKTEKNNNHEENTLPDAIRLIHCRNDLLPFHALTTEDQVLLLTFSRDHLNQKLTYLALHYPESRILATKDSTLCDQFQEYLQGKRSDFSFSPHPFFLQQGTAFQQKIWDLIARIPYGGKMSYGALAKEIGHIRYARAVGRACNSNPVALIIPCHRVTGARDIGGFAGGITAKKRLLKIEEEKG